MFHEKKVNWRACCQTNQGHFLKFFRMIKKNPIYMVLNVSILIKTFEFCERYLIIIIIIIISVDIFGLSMFYRYTFYKKCNELDPTWTYLVFSNSYYNFIVFRGKIYYFIIILKPITYYLTLNKLWNVCIIHNIFLWFTYYIKLWPLFVAKTR